MTSATQVCDQPHPVAVKSMMAACTAANFEVAYDQLVMLWNQGT